MKVKTFLLASALLLSSAIQSFAQDPGFQAPRTGSARQTTSPSGASSGATTMSAGMLNSMDVLDNTRAIRPGDVLSLRVVEDRKEPIQVSVGVTGEIQAPYVGLVKAAGKTSRQLADSIKVDLEKAYFQTATVIVTIDSTPPDRGGIYTTDMEFFTVFGQVIRQGKYEIPSDEDITMSQAILRAGGFAQFANPKAVKLVRTTPQGNKTILINCDDIMRKGNLNNDIYIRDGDVLIIDEKKINF